MDACVPTVPPTAPPQTESSVSFALMAVPMFHKIVLFDPLAADKTHDQVNPSS